MANSKVINGADLQLALQENNKKVKDYVGDIKKYQKYVNTELEYCYLGGSATLNYTGTGALDTPIIMNATIRGNMEVTDDNCVVLRKGKTYHINGTLRASTSSSDKWAVVGYTLRVNNTSTNTNLVPAGFSYVNSHVLKGTYNNKDLVGSITPTDDIKVNVVLIEISGVVKDCSFGITIQEVGRQIAIDPLEHANSTSGIEDAPVGHIISFMGNNVPAHYLACDGSTYNIADYPYLSQHFIDEFGSVNYFGGDGTTTFAVPDLRGEFLRGTGTATRNTGTGATVGTHQDGTRHFNIGSVGTGIGVATKNLTSGGVRESLVDKSVFTTKNMRVVETNSTQEVSTAVNEQYTSRPTNTAVLYCIKYEPTYFMQNTYIGNEEVVLYEGNTKVECGNTGVTYDDLSISLSDSIDNYDAIEIFYGSYTAMADIGIINNLTVKATDTDKQIWLNIMFNTMFMSLRCSFSNDTFSVISSKFYNPEAITTTVLGINIYRIVGYRTSLKTQEE